VHYKDIVAGEFRADFLVNGKVVVELKALKVLTDGDEAQLLNYLKGRSLFPQRSGERLLRKGKAAPEQLRSKKRARRNG
jgi:hypothetical protein